MASQGCGGGWSESIPIVFPKGTHGSGALDTEPRPPRRGHQALRGREFPGATTKGRLPRAAAAFQTVSIIALITLGAELAKCDLVLKGNTPLHAC